MRALVEIARTFKESIQEFAESIESLELSQLIALVSFCLVLLHGFRVGYFQVVIGIMLIIFIIDRRVVCTWWFWACLSLMQTLALVRIWEDTGNHNYVITYWMWVMTCTFAVRESMMRERIILFNARFFIVFIFLAAVLQKYLSPSYMSGEMFEMKLLTSNGFRAFAVSMGINPSIMAAVQNQIDLLSSPAANVYGNVVAIPSNDHVHRIALWVTWYDFYVQVAIGFLFLLRRCLADLVGHVLMLFFVFTAYFFVPITGFGWPLSIMGLALTKGQFPRLHIIYFASLIALVSYHLPWHRIILWLGSM